MIYVFDDEDDRFLKAFYEASHNGYPMIIIILFRNISYRHNVIIDVFTIFFFIYSPVNFVALHIFFSSFFIIINVANRLCMDLIASEYRYV